MNTMSIPLDTTSFHFNEQVPVLSLIVINNPSPYWFVKRMEGEFRSVGGKITGIMGNNKKCRDKKFRSNHQNV